MATKRRPGTGSLGAAAGAEPHTPRFVPIPALSPRPRQSPAPPGQAARGRRGAGVPSRQTPGSGDRPVRGPQGPGRAELLGSRWEAGALPCRQRGWEQARDPRAPRTLSSASPPDEQRGRAPGRAGARNTPVPPLALTLRLYLGGETEPLQLWAGAAAWGSGRDGPRPHCIPRSPRGWPRLLRAGQEWAALPAPRAGLWGSTEPSAQAAAPLLLPRAATSCGAT